MKLQKILLSIMIFLIYFYFFDILNYFFNVLNIDYHNFSNLGFKIFLYLTEILPVIFLIITYRKDLRKDTENFKNNTLPNIEKYTCLWILAMLIMGISNIFISRITGSTNSNNEEAIKSMAEILPVYMAFSTCIIAPIGEELAFRKTIRKMCENKKLAIILSGIIFGLAHVIGTYESLTDFLYIVPYGAFGCIFMYMYLDSDSIFTTMFIHFTHNTLLTIMMLIGV